MSKKFFELPPLYKLAKTGAVSVWRVSVEEEHVPINEWPAQLVLTYVVTTHGTLNGQLQVDRVQVKSGKNVGRSNETSVRDQAEALVKQKWQKKFKAGYTTDLEKAQRGEDEVGGYKPVLAEKYEDFSHKIAWPCVAQPKLDGMRCLAVYDGGKVTLLSRSRKAITSCPHVEDGVKSIVENTLNPLRKPEFKVVLDGELYRHGMLFEHMMSALRRKEPNPEAVSIPLHIFDGFFPGKERMTYDLRRSEIVDELIHYALPVSHLVQIVPDRYVLSHEGAQEFLAEMLEAGFEGAILRDRFAPYVGARTHSLLKLKTMHDEEFTVVGVVEGEGRMAGKAVFKCITKDGKDFTCNMRGLRSSLADMLRDKGLYIGRQLTVQFQGWTEHGKPRFPVGLRFRKEE